MRRPAGPDRVQVRPVLRLLALLAAAAAALSPVEYRGGAERSHAHSPFQLWYDVAGGALAHHGRDAAGGAPTAAARTTTSPSAAEASPDVPRASAMASAERTASIPVVAAAAAASLAPIRIRRHWPPIAALAGRAVRPEPPPPRPLVAPA